MSVVGSILFETDEIKKIVVDFALEIQKQLSSTIQGKKKRIIVLAGPTGCGKSKLAIELAQAIGGEIVSADSIQVYRNMDIGTAKVSKKERLLIPHHLIDIRDLHETFNVVDFFYEARKTCTEILERGNVPIVAGGSGFYIHTLLYGPPSGPPSIPEVRIKLEAELETKGSDFLFSRLIELDPEYAKSITKNDKQKIVRALEIISVGTQKVSKLPWKGRRIPRDYDFHCWFLHRPKEKLYERIDHRCDKMLKDGFLAEVEQFAQEIKNNSSVSQAIGYRQALDYFSSPQTNADYEKFVSAFKQATRHYVKRQFTWFRKEPLFHWLDVELHDHETTLDMIRKDYELL